MVGAPACHYLLRGGCSQVTCYFEVRSRCSQRSFGNVLLLSGPPGVPPSASPALPEGSSGRAHSLDCSKPCFSWGLRRASQRKARVLFSEKMSSLAFLRGPHAPGAVLSTFWVSAQASSALTRAGGGHRHFSCSNLRLELHPLPRDAWLVRVELGSHPGSLFPETKLFRQTSHTTAREGVPACPAVHGQGSGTQARAALRFSSRDWYPDVC